MADFISPSPPPVRHRRWYRLHFSTWVIVLLGLAIGALLIVPGEEGWYPSRQAPDPDRAMVHGWPITCLWRIPKGWSDLFDGDKTPYVWHVFTSIRAFSAAALAFDIAVIAASVAILAALWEWRRRLGRKRWQFSLRSLLIAVTLFGVLLTWWSFERRADGDLLEHLLALETRPSFLPTARFREPRFPLWLRAIVNDERLNELGITRLRYGLDAIWTSATHEHVQYLVSRFPEEVAVEFNNTPDDNELDSFLELSQLRILIIHDAPSRVVGRLSTLPELRRLHIGAHHDRALDDAGMICLAKMPSLRVLDIIDAHRITEASLAQLAETSRLEFLSLFRPKLTRGGLKRIAAIPTLRELTILVSPLTDRDLEPLTGNDRIERLLIGTSFVTDDGLKTLGSMSALKWLSVSGEPLTDGAMAQFRKLRPDVQVHLESNSNDLADLKTSIDDVIAGNTTRLAIGMHISDDDLTGLDKLTVIDSIALNSRHLTDATLARVGKLTLLKELDVSGSQITAKGLRFLADLPHIRTLTLDEEQATDNAIAVLRRLPALKHVWVRLGLEPADSKKLEGKMRASLHDLDLHFEEPQARLDPWE